MQPRSLLHVQLWTIVQKTTMSHRRLLNRHYGGFFYVFIVNLMFHILKILLIISPFVSFQQNHFWHAKTFPLIVNIMLVNKWSLFYCALREFFLIVFIFWHILRFVSFFRGLNIMPVINHSSLQLTFSSNRPIGLQGFTATRISPIYVWKNSETTSVFSSYCFHQDTGEVTDFSRPP